MKESCQNGNLRIFQGTGDASDYQYSLVGPSWRQKKITRRYWSPLNQWPTAGYKVPLPKDLLQSRVRSFLCLHRINKFEILTSLLLSIDRWRTFCGTISISLAFFTMKQSSFETSCAMSCIKSCITYLPRSFWKKDKFTRSSKYWPPICWSGMLPWGSTNPSATQISARLDLSKL